MIRSRLFLWIFTSVLLAAAGPATRSAKHAELARPQRYIDDIKYLAAPERQGRGAGTAGLEQASKYIASEFERLGLRPAGENGTWWQSFQVTTSAKPGTQNELTMAGKGPLKLQSDYVPLSFSSNGSADAEVVFAGYGITAPERHYDDYAGLDVKDRIVLVLRYEPPQFHDKKAGPERYTHHAHLVSKAINARNHGAKAVILVNGTVPKEDKLIAFGTVAGPENVGLQMIQVRNGIADEWLRASDVTLSELQNRINSKQQPASQTLAGTGRVSLRVDIQRDQAEIKNVLGYLPGTSNEYVIVGAHYDHLGKGGEGSLAPSQNGQVHPGADDNASGTAGVLEVARILAGQKGQLRRGVLFMTFAGEEIGLLGSAHWVNHPTMPLQNAVAMLNMDMIGRMNGSKLYIGGSGTGSTFEPLLKKTLPEYPLKADYSEDGYSASDHTSFLSKSIPALFFFSGLHGDYHKPTDTWDKISAQSAAEVVDLVAEITKQLASADRRPQYVKVEPKSHGAIPGGEGSGSGYGPYFGSIPDFAPVEKGVRFSDVRPGSPAAKAGLQAGDILTGFGDQPINNLYDFTFALRSKKVGDVVKVVVLRNGKEVTASVTLEARQ